MSLEVISNVKTWLTSNSSSHPLLLGIFLELKKPNINFGLISIFQLFCNMYHYYTNFLVILNAKINFIFLFPPAPMHSKFKLMMEVDLGQKFSKFNILLGFFQENDGKIELEILLPKFIDEGKNAKSIITVSVFRIFSSLSYILAY